MSLRSVAGTVVVTGLLAIGAVVQLRAAGGPIIFSQEIDDRITVGFCGFPIEIRTTGTARIHLFLSSDGSFERVIVTQHRRRD